MTLLPEHAQLLAQVRHRELVAAAEQHRWATRWGRRATGTHPDPAPDCRVPTAARDHAPAPATTAAACRPDPRRRPGRSAARRSLRAWWGHWPGRRRGSRSPR